MQRGHLRDDRLHAGGLPEAGQRHIGDPLQLPPQHAQALRPRDRNTDARLHKGGDMLRMAVPHRGPPCAEILRHGARPLDRRGQRGPVAAGAADEVLPAGRRLRLLPPDPRQLHGRLLRGGPVAPVLRQGLRRRRPPMGVLRRSRRKRRGDPQAHGLLLRRQVQRAPVRFAGNRQDLVREKPRQGTGTRSVPDRPGRQGRRKHDAILTHDRDPDVQRPGSARKRADAH